MHILFMHVLYYLVILLKYTHNFSDSGRIGTLYWSSIMYIDWIMQCKVCMQTFMCTTSEVKCREHAEAKHPKSDVYACFPHLKKWTYWRLEVEKIYIIMASSLNLFTEIFLQFLFILNVFSVFVPWELWEIGRAGCFYYNLSSWQGNKLCDAFTFCLAVTA